MRILYTSYIKLTLSGEVCQSIHFFKNFFFTLSIVYISIKLQHFVSWIFFRLQVEKEGQKP
jgi:hypothetical protein